MFLVNCAPVVCSLIQYGLFLLSLFLFSWWETLTMLHAREIKNVYKKGISPRLLPMKNSTQTLWVCYSFQQLYSKSSRWSERTIPLCLTSEHHFVWVCLFTFVLMCVEPGSGEAIFLMESHKNPLTYLCQQSEKDTEVCEATSRLSVLFLTLCFQSKSSQQGHNKVWCLSWFRLACVCMWAWNCVFLFIVRLWLRPG